MTRTLTLSEHVPCTPDAAYRGWTDGQKTAAFMAETNHVVPEVGGAFEHYFVGDAPEGQRGSEGCTFAALVPGRSLTFTWNFPPTLPSLRTTLTEVTVTFDATSEGCTVTLSQRGWGEGADWDEGFAYFRRAWRIVLDRFKEAVIAGLI